MAAPSRKPGHLGGNKLPMVGTAAAHVDHASQGMDALSLLNLIICF